MPRTKKEKKEKIKPEEKTVNAVSWDNEKREYKTPSFMELAFPPLVVILVVFLIGVLVYSMTKKDEQVPDLAVEESEEVVEVQFTEVDLITAYNRAIMDTSKEIYEGLMSEEKPLRYIVACKNEEECTPFVVSPLTEETEYNPTDGVLYVLLPEEEEIVNLP